MQATKGHSRQIEYVGSATSDFQAEPLLYDEEGRPRVITDWEFELTRRVQGQPCGIPDADTTALPQFLGRRESYIRRSAELSENMVRLSLDFGRLCPEEGQFNEPLMKEYVKTLALIRLCGQEPFLTLHHFTMPKYLIETDQEGIIKIGAWEHRDAVQHFRFYVEKVIRFLANQSTMRGILAELGLSQDAQDKILSEGLVCYFMPINEPTVLLFNSYLGGMFPPYKRGNLLMVRRLLHRLVKVHDMALDEIKQGLKAQKCEPQIGVGHNWQYFEGFLGKVARWFQESFVTSFERQGSHSDFLGIHYYFRWKEPLTAGERRRLDYSDQPAFGDVYPPGIRNVIAQVNSLYPQKPIFISEFGFSDRSDLRRPYWILETVRHILEAKRTGMPIKGMLLWTLVSNFEWQLGMSQKFGLFSESELNEPPVPSTKGIRSWEAWSAASKAIGSPTIDNLQELQRCHRTAYAQYKEAGGRY
jgi:beta-glucosidase